MRKISTLLLFLFLAMQASAQSTYKNGVLSTGATTKSGVAAPAGYTWSELQNDNGNTTESNTNLGFGASGDGTSNLRIADDFTVPSGQQWQISQFHTYGYQTGYTGTASPFNGIRVQIWNGNPSTAGSSIVFGDLTTNRFVSSIDSLTYRIGNTQVPTATTPGTTRKLWRITADLTGVNLPAGTYWIEWQVTTTSGTGSFLPPATVVGARTVTGWNAVQFNGTWGPLLDAGNPAAAPDVAQDMPFELTYNNVLPVTISAFEAERKNEINLLNWSTATEQNNNGFEIERSADGIRFSKIGFVKSLATEGNSVNSISYSFIDNRPLKSTAFYRLKQIDKDGKINFSKIASVKGDQSFGIAIYPNPVRETLNVAITSNRSEKTMIVITDLSGKIVMQINSFLVIGDNNLSVNVSTLITGSYYIRVVNSSSEFKVAQFIKN